MIAVSSESDWARGSVSEADLESFRPRIRATALRIVGCPNLADDVAQNALTRAVQSISTGSNVQNVWAWLRRITLHVALDTLKSRTEESLSEKSQPVVTLDTHGLSVRDALSRISPEHQSILALAFGERLSYKEISEALEIPMGTVASRISAAKAAFRIQWGEQ